MMPPKNSFILRNSAAIGIFLVTLLMLLVALMFYRQAQIVSNAKDRVLHSYNVSGHVQLLMGKLRDAELGQRGYTITGDESYLEPYRSAITDYYAPSSDALEQGHSIAQEMNILRHITQGNTDEQNDLNQLQVLIGEFLKFQADTIHLRQQSLNPSLSAGLSAERGKTLMDAIRMLVDDMLAEENSLLAERTQIDEISTQRNEILTFGTIALFYIGMVFSVRLITRNANRARRLEAAIVDQAEEMINTNRKLKLSNRELVESRTFLKNIINHIPDPIFVKDVDHRWIEGNSAMWALFGKPENELIGKNDYDFFPQEEADIFWQKDNEVFGSGQVNVNVENFTDAAHNTHIISTKKATFNGFENKPVLVGVIRDITELMRMQEKLKESDEARLKSIMEHSGQLVHIKDLQGKYLQVNKHLLKVMQRDDKDVIGKTDYELFPEHYADGYHVNDLAVIEKATALEYEEKMPEHDGEHTYMSVKFPLYDAKDSMYAICGISTDITERKRIEAQRLRYMHELKRSNQELDDFAYIASHDLKEPLRGLFNHASFLMEDYRDKLDGDGVYRLTRLSLLCQRMEHLVNDLLYYSRLGRTELAIQETDPNAVVNDIRQMMESSLKEAHAEIVVPKPMPVIVCDKPRVTEVFRNLITNAVKYNDKDQRMVEVGFVDSMVAPHGAEHNVFYVRDNGIGIEKEFHEEIFRIFKRLQASTGDKDGGTGVGLTFVKKIIERHNGRIWLESAPGTGSTFYFTIGRREA